MAKHWGTKYESGSAALMSSSKIQMIGAGMPFEDWLSSSPQVNDLTAGNVSDGGGYAIAARPKQ